MVKRLNQLLKKMQPSMGISIPTMVQQWSPSKNKLHFQPSPPWSFFFRHSFWHTIWKYIWHVYSDILSDNIWHSFRHILWHSVWHSIWNLSWHTFWHIFWHFFWHSIWYIFGDSLWLRSGGEHCDPALAVEVRRDDSDPGLAVRVRRGPLRSGACSWHNLTTRTWQVGKTDRTNMKQTEQEETAVTEAATRESVCRVT